MLCSTNTFYNIYISWWRELDPFRFITTVKALDEFVNDQILINILFGAEVDRKVDARVTEAAISY
jgi:hypothetical protein